MVNRTDKLITVVSILTRRLKEGKTYDDFRKAWFHTTGFGVKGKKAKGASNRMVSMINVFDPREVVVLGFATVTLDMLEDALNIDVKFRGENPMDAVIEPEIGRKFCSVVAEDDFSAVGDIPYTEPSVNGHKIDITEFYQYLQAINELYSTAGKKRDALTEERKQQGNK